MFMWDQVERLGDVFDFGYVHHFGVFWVGVHWGVQCVFGIVSGG